MTGHDTSNSRHWLHVATWLLVPVLIAAVSYWLGWDNIFETWTQINAIEIAVALALLLLTCALQASRLHDYFPRDMTGKWLTSLRVTLLHNLQANIHPVPAQTSAFPRLMKSHFGVDYAYALSAQLWFRLLDLHTLLTFSLYPLFVVTPLKRLAIPIIVLWAVLPILLYLFRNTIEVRFAGKDGSISELVQQTLFGLPDSWGEFWRCWLMTWAIWIVRLITLAWLLGQLLPDVSWNMLLLGVTSGELAIFLPFYLPAHFGLYEAGVASALTAATTTLPPAIIGAISIHLFTLATSLLGGLLGWLLPGKSPTA